MTKSSVRLKGNILRDQDDLLVALSDPNSRLVIFGAGIIGRHVADSMLNYLDKNSDGKLVAFCDNF